MFGLSLSSVREASAELKSLLEQFTDEEEAKEMRKTAQELIERAAQLEA
jgi:hypothetical protein